MLLPIVAVPLFALPIASALAVRTGSDYLANSISTAGTLQKLFYEDSIGLWTSLGAHSPDPGAYWWTSANCLSTLGLLASLDNSTMALVGPILENTFDNALAFNTKQTKTGTWMQPTIDDGHVTSYYRDALIWAMTWVHTYDLTGEKKYLETTLGIFQEIAYVSGANATCGGLWADSRHTQQDSITNALWLAVTTHLATRLDNGDYYLNWALNHWEWYKNSGLIQSDFLIVQSLDIKTCKAVSSGPTYSHVLGITIGGLLELNKAAPDQDYIDLAVNIADSSLKALSDNNGILTEYGSHGSPLISIAEATYKGLYVRHIVLLASLLNDSTYIAYLKKQADSIWTVDRSPSDGALGVVWDHFYPLLDASGQCAAFDALVAAATVA